MVKDGTFREDLFYRLNVIPINLPPLRERREDIPLLVQNFVEHFCESHKLEPKTVSPQVMKALMAYDWPGNVRQLENLVERMVALTGNRQQSCRRICRPKSTHREALNYVPLYRDSRRRNQFPGRCHRHGARTDYSKPSENQRQQETCRQASKSRSAQR